MRMFKVKKAAVWKTEVYDVFLLYIKSIYVKIT